MFPPKQQDSDAPIRATDNDALLARLSAVQKGYLDDPFVNLFVPRAHLQPPRPPLINIGTYIRSESIDRLVESWAKICESGAKKFQIVSLGAGSDSRFWRLAVRQPMLGKISSLMRLTDRLAIAKNIWQGISKLITQKSRPKRQWPSERTSNSMQSCRNTAR